MQNSIPNQAETLFAAIIQACNGRPLWSFSTKNRTITILADRPIHARVEVRYGRDAHGTFTVLVDISDVHTTLTGEEAWVFMERLNTSEIGVFGSPSALALAEQTRAVLASLRGGAA
jgi:hypothetical protein